MTLVDVVVDGIIRVDVVVVVAAVAVVVLVIVNVEK